MSSGDLHSLLSEPARIRALTQCIRAKIPSHDVDDVVQSTLADALTAVAPPLEESALDRWLNGIARHKVADYYRSHRRHVLIDAELDGQSAPVDTHSENAHDLLRWVKDELPAGSEAPRTLEWMMREADGDRLESIAEENNLSAPTVRQRVSRLRRHLRERWALQLAAAVTLAVVVAVYVHKQRGPTIEPEVVRRAEPPAWVAQKLRQSALADCRSKRWQTCLEQLDRAKDLDPAGEGASAIAEARADIARALQPAPAPVPSASEQRQAPAQQVTRAAQPKHRRAPAPVQSQSPKSKSEQKMRQNTQSANDQANSNSQSVAMTQSAQPPVSQVQSPKNLAPRGQ
jgi:RNA polymerase sigma factor (sigma-70 family)